MKHLFALLILLLVCSWCHTIRAQATDSWVSVPLEGERLTVWMPKSHEVFSLQQFKVEGRVYSATEDGVDYSIWTLIDKAEVRDDPAANLSYLDYCADLVWESLLKPRRDQIPEAAKLESRMSYASKLTWTSLQVNKEWYLPQGREYSIMLGKRPGKTQFYVAGRQIYILIVLNEDADRAAAQRFVNSFRPNKEVDPKLLPRGTGGGIGPGRGGNTGGYEPLPAANGGTNYNRVFTGKEVTQKARVVSKPEPSYTESARKYAVQGTVVLRAVVSRSGEVTDIRVFNGLPHGLSAKAVDAARRMRFIPAQKDGHEVSMFIQLEYNFNLY